MFKELNLKSTYSSYEDDMGIEFYIPTLQTCVKYDRATAYFSAKALANYAKGMEMFAQKGNLCRMVISSEISQEDFEQIKQGYKSRDKINHELILKLREELSLEDERNISNFAYLISLGVIEVKIAFTEQGIFHDKFGVMEDEAGDYICFRGSNNETTAAFNTNYEAFDITCSWQASEFDYSKITKSKEVFKKLWNNEVDKLFVCDVDEAVMKEILTYDKGKVIVDKVQLEKDCFILDYEIELKLEIRTDPEVLNKNRVKVKLNRYFDLQRSNQKVWKFKSHYTYTAYKKIISILENDSKKRGYKFFVTDRLKKYIEEREMHLHERSKIGLAIKSKDQIVLSQYEEYKNIVDKEFTRKLREKQMWDSFYMYTMKKSSNFSVPGSGKTASVLGVYAYLNSKGIVKRIVMIGPINSFGSWIDEFKACFGDKQNIQSFSIQDDTLTSRDLKKQAITFNTGRSNLLLFNYESVGPYISEIKKIVKNDTLLVFDEVHKIKKYPPDDGSRASYALKIAEDAKYIIALTGTPIPNSYTDIRNLLDVLYHNEYNEFFGFSPQQLKNPDENDMVEINMKLQPFFCRTTKKELSVPEANKDNIITVEASNNENELFNILVMKYAKDKLALIIRLLQLESNPRMLLQKIDPSEFSDILDISADTDDIDYVDLTNSFINLVNSMENTRKFDNCIDLAKDLISSGKKIIIWCIFKDSLLRINEAIEKLGYKSSVIYGDVKMNEREPIINGFRAGEIDCLVTNPHTLAESVSLHSICHDAIYFEYSYNLVHLLQSKDRIHRLGLPEGQYTQYYYLQELFTNSEGDDFSLDANIYSRLKEKEQIMLDAIENNILEKGNTTQEDIDIIFGDLKI